MTQPFDAASGCTFEDAERAHLRQWIALSSAAKVDFFEEMIQLAYQSGALAPARLAMRDRARVSRRQTPSG